MLKKKLYKIISLFGFVIAIVFYFQNNQKTSFVNSTKSIEKQIAKDSIVTPSKIYFESKRNLKLQNEIYLIVENTLVFGNTKFCQMKIDEKEVKNYKNSEDLIPQSKSSQERYDLLDYCEYKNCYFSCNKSLADKADALLFHDVKSTNLDFKRKESQVLIYWNDESTAHNPNVDYLNVNWTISYKQESEASYCAYGCYRNKTKILLKNFNQFTKNEFKNRKNNALWFVSNCNSDYRNRFTAGLSLNYPITVYGNCKNVIESKYANKINFNTNSCHRNSECELNELKTNKFFLAFENSNCSSYITEKFWRSLHYGVIPVVVQPKKESYDAVAPPNSFIHASDFDFDLDRLAAYLNKVAGNFELYSKYLQWKMNYEAIFEPKLLEQQRICELCTKLNTYSTKGYYTSVSKYFNSDCK